jgi:hypothetical protein
LSTLFEYSVLICVTFDHIKLRYTIQTVLDIFKNTHNFLFWTGLLDRGSQFHSAIQNHLSGAPESDLKLDQIQGCWQSLTDVITEVTDVKVVESHVVHSSLVYRGVIDCVAHYK